MAFYAVQYCLKDDDVVVREDDFILESSDLGGACSKANEKIISILASLTHCTSADVVVKPHDQETSDSENRLRILGVNDRTSGRGIDGYLHDI